MALGIALLWELFIALIGIALLAKSVVPLPSRKTAARTGRESNYRNADAARERANSEYAKNHPQRERLARACMTGLAAGLAVVSTCVLVNTSNATSGTIATAALLFQAACAVAFVILQRMKTRETWPEIQHAWNGSPA